MAVTGKTRNRAFAALRGGLTEAGFTSVGEASMNVMGASLRCERWARNGRSVLLLEKAGGGAELLRPCGDTVEEALSMAVLSTEPDKPGPLFEDKTREAAS